LQAALVPDWEWPYKLPENWCWVKASAVARIYTGNSISEKIKADKYAGQQEGLLFIATKDIGFDNAINYETDIRIPDYPNFKIAPANTALLCIEGGSAGRKVGFVNREVCFGNKLCVFAAEKVNSKFIYYILQSQYFIQQFNNRKHGLIGGVSVNDLAEIGFPLSPLAEQQRIVDRIESLFAKLDEAKEKAQAVVDSFETRKAAILHKAFTGELTAKWREDHGVRMESWEKKRLSDVVTEFKYGTSEKSDYNNKGIPVLRIPNIGDNGIDLSDIKYLNHRNVDSESQIHEGDILIIRSNGSRDLVGKAVLVPELGCEYAYASFLIRAKLNHSIINAHYLTIFLNSTDARGQMFRRAKSSAGINNINTKELGAISLTVPSLPEQDEIVHIINEMMDKDQQSKEAAEAVLDQIDLMKKSILVRAFRGELGTNDPNEESAVELLKEIIRRG
jgi:type I restriction enzyme S subunit